MGAAKNASGSMGRLSEKRLLKHGKKRLRHGRIFLCGDNIKTEDLISELFYLICAMKQALFTLVFAFISLLASAQEYRDNELQPDSVYKANKVRIRTGVHPRSHSKSKEIYVFDREGRPVTFILTDNETGKLPQEKFVYTYNDKGILSSETDSLYWRDLCRVSVSELFYAENGPLIRQTVKNHGRLVSEKYFYPSERKVTEKLYQHDTVYREQTTIYDVQGKQVRFYGREYGDPNAKPQVTMFNGKPFTYTPSTSNMVWDYAFVNTYDQSGNLLIQERFENGQQKGKTNYIMGRHGLFSGVNDIVYIYAYY